MLAVAVAEVERETNGWIPDRETSVVVDHSHEQRICWIYELVLVPIWPTITRTTLHRASDPLSFQRQVFF